MNLYQLMSQVEARDDARLAELASADEAYLQAEKAAQRGLTFDDLLEALDRLPDQTKQEALREAAQSKTTELLANAYERLLEKKTGHLLDRVITCARQINGYHAIEHS